MSTFQDLNSPDVDDQLQEARGQVNVISDGQLLQLILQTLEIQIAEEAENADGHIPQTPHLQQPIQSLEQILQKYQQLREQTNQVCKIFKYMSVIN